MKIIVFFAVLLFVSVSLFSVLPRQSDAGKPPLSALLQRVSQSLFDDRVHTISIGIDRMLFEQHVLRRKRTYARAGTFSFDGLILKDVGVRFRGNTPDNAGKPQLKFNFACRQMVTEAGGTTRLFAENSGRRFQGVKCINLRCNPSLSADLITDKLSSEVFRAAGALYPRIGLARLYVNGVYYGLYLLTEQIDGTFLKTHLGNSIGNGFKLAWTRNKVLGPFPGMPHSFPYRVFRKGDAAAGDDLQAFLQGIAAARMDGDFSRLFAVDHFVAYWAASVLSGHWDSLLGNLQNDHLFHNAADGKWYCIGWDGDNNFDMAFRLRGGISMYQEPIDGFYQCHETSVIFRQAYRIRGIHAAYTNKLASLLANVFHPTRLHARMDRMAALLLPYLPAEPPASRLGSAAFQAELLRIKEYISRRHGHVSFQLNSRQVKGKATVFFRIEAPLVPDGRIYLSGDIGALGNMESGNPGLVLHQADRSGDRGVYTNRLVLERACFFKIRLRARPEGWHAAEQQSMSDGKKSRIVCALPGKSEYRASVRRWGGN